jgi:dCTP diphosphatase
MPPSTTSDSSDDRFVALTERLLRFRDEREWDQFHTPKELAVALAIEAAELLEHFRWMSDREVSEHVTAEREAVADEIADVAAFLIYLAESMRLDLIDAVNAKFDRNEERYPPDRSRGVHTKYSRFEP